MPEINITDPQYANSLLNHANKTSADFVMANSFIENKSIPTANSDYNYLSFLGDTYVGTGTAAFVNGMSSESRKNPSDDMYSKIYQQADERSYNELVDNNNAFQEKDAFPAYDAKARGFNQEEPLDINMFNNIWIHSSPADRLALEDLSSKTLITEGMTRADVNNLLDVYHEEKSREQRIAEYTAGWGSPKKFIAGLPALVFDPINYIPIGHIGKLKAVFAGAEAAGAVATASLATKAIAGGLSSTALMARGARIAKNMGNGAATLGTYSLATKLMYDAGTKNVMNNPGAGDEFDALLSGAALGAATFGLASGLAQVWGMTFNPSMKTLAQMRTARSKGVDVLSDHIEKLRASELPTYGPAENAAAAKTPVTTTSGGLVDPAAPKAPAMTPIATPETAVDNIKTALGDDVETLTNAAHDAIHGEPVRPAPPEPLPVTAPIAAPVTPAKINIDSVMAAVAAKFEGGAEKLQRLLIDFAPKKASSLSKVKGSTKLTGTAEKRLAFVNSESQVEALLAFEPDLKQLREAIVAEFKRLEEASKLASESTAAKVAMDAEAASKAAADQAAFDAATEATKNWTPQRKDLSPQEFVAWLESATSSDKGVQNLIDRANTASGRTSVPIAEAPPVNVGTSTPLQRTEKTSPILENVRENATLVNNLIDLAKRGITRHSGAADMQLHIPIYRHVRANRAKSLNSLVELYRKRGIEVVLHEHPNQIHFDRINQVNRLLKAARDIAKSDYTASQSAFNLFRAVDKVNSYLPLINGPEGTMRNAVGNPMDQLISTLFTTVENTAEDSMMGTASRTSAEDILSERSNAKKILVNRIVSKYRDAVGAKGFKRIFTKPTNEEGWSASIEMYRREREIAAHGSFTPDPTITPGVEAIIKELEAHYKGYSKDLLDTGLMLESGGTTKVGYFVPHMLEKLLVKEDRAGFISSVIKQFQYQHDLSHGNYLNLLTFGRLWEAVGSGFSKPELAALLEKAGFDITELANAKTSRAFMDILESQDLAKLPSLKDLKTADVGLHTQYLQMQDTVWRESAENLYSKVTADGHLGIRDSLSTAVSTPDNLKARTFYGGMIPEMTKYMQHDMIAVMDRYTAQIDGEISVAKAAQMSKDTGLMLREGSTMRSPKNAQEILKAIGQFRESLGGILERMNKKESAEITKSLVTGQLDIIEQKLKNLIGQTHFVDNIERGEWQPWISRNFQRAILLQKGGSMPIPNLIDMSSMIVEGLKPGNFTQFAKGIANGIVPFINAASKESRVAMLESLGMCGEIIDLAVKKGRKNTGRDANGVAFTDTIDYAMDRTAKRFLRATGLDYVNALTRNAGAIKGWMMTVNGARILERARLNVEGMSIDINSPNYLKTLRSEANKLGLSNYELARLSKNGVTARNVQYVTQEIHKNGVFWHEDQAVSSISFAEFLQSERPVRLDFYSSKIERPDVFNNIRTNIQSGARHYYNVTPGVLNRPIFEDKFPALRIISQFTAFVSAYSAQRLRPMAQMPTSQSSSWLISAVVGGWLVNAIQNDLSGRMKFQDSVNEMVERPHAAIYKGIASSGQLGGISRLFGVADATGVGPAKILGANSVGGAAGAMAREQTDLNNIDPGLGLLSIGGPAVGTFRDAVSGGYAMGRSAIGGKPLTDSEKLMLNRSAPFQNALPLRMLNYVTSDPSSPGGVIPYGTDYQLRQNLQRKYR